MTQREYELKLSYHVFQKWQEGFRKRTLDNERKLIMFTKRKFFKKWFDYIYNKAAKLLKVN